MRRHHVSRAGSAPAAVPAGYADRCDGFARAPHVDGREGSAHGGFASCELRAGGRTFHKRTAGRVRWLETQAPLPPAAHSDRFNRDWDHLAARLDGAREDR